MPIANTPPIITDISDVTPAPMLWRAVALLLDCSLAGLVACIILTRLVLPSDYPDAEKTVRTQFDTWKTEIKQAESANGRPQFTFDEEAMNISADTLKTFFLTTLVYFVASELVMGGGTLGKKVFGLRAARLGTGDMPGMVEIFSRCLFKVASLFLFWPIMLVANAVPVLVRPARRSGHDYLARTIVTRDAPPPAPESALGHDEEE